MVGAGEILGEEILQLEKVEILMPPNIIGNTNSFKKLEKVL
jgi:hypothetical protein